MALDTYSGLKQSVIDHLDRSDLDTFADDFIDIAEARHQSEVRFREMLTRDSFTAVTRYADLPLGYLDAKTFRLLTDPVTYLISLTQHEMDRRRSETPGLPFYFTIHEQVEFDRTPDQAYQGEIIYYKALTPLSTSNTSNALLKKAPHVYLYSALVASAPFLGDPERIAEWETLYQNGKNNIGLMDNRQVGPMFTTVSGATP